MLVFQIPIEYNKSQKKRPLLKLKLDGKTFEGLVDTGADATISSKDWPSVWPLDPSLTHLKRIGQTSNPLQSSQVISWKDEVGNKGTDNPLVTGLPVNLWGRDILSQMRLTKCSPNELITQQMLNQGYRPGQGLGKNSRLQ